MRKILIIFCFSVPTLTHAQWQGAGATSGSGDMYYTGGDVGIGTTNPSAKLDVYGSIKLNGGIQGLSITNLTGSEAGYGSFVNYGGLAIDGNSGTNRQMFMFSDGSIGHNIFTIASSLNSGATWDSRFAVKQDGNIGIGTNSPGQKLTVQGVIRSQLSPTNFVNNFFVSGDGNCYMNYSGGSPTSRVGFQIDGGSKVSLYNNGNFVVHSGNLGIGYNDPKYKLSVNGTVSATEVKVSTTPNSDYVFEPDYDLKPIEEVASFIKEHKHLPDIPSAEEFKENGVGLGEMDNMLLRKVEELTLYVIEQHGKLETQSTKLEWLEKENEELKNENLRQNNLIRQLIEKHED